MQRESVGHTIKIATLLCVVCSVAVSVSAVVLRPRQEANKALEVKKNILSVSGLLDDDDIGK